MWLENVEALVLWDRYWMYPDKRWWMLWCHGNILYIPDLAIWTCIWLDNTERLKVGLPLKMVRQHEVLDRLWWWEPSIPEDPGNGEVVKACLREAQINCSRCACALMCACIFACSGQSSCIPKLTKTSSWAYAAEKWIWLYGKQGLKWQLVMVFEERRWKPTFHHPRRCRTLQDLVCVVGSIPLEFPFIHMNVMTENTELFRDNSAFFVLCFTPMTLEPTTSESHLAFFSGPPWCHSVATSRTSYAFDAMLWFLDFC